MNKWIQFVPESELVEGEYYFLAKKVGAGVHSSIVLYGEGLSGKRQWTVKPGIAVKAVCDEKFRSTLRSNANYVAVKIPSDAENRWKARTPRSRRQP